MTNRPKITLSEQASACFSFPLKGKSESNAGLEENGYFNIFSKYAP